MRAKAPVRPMNLLGVEESTDTVSLSLRAPTEQATGADLSWGTMSSSAAGALPPHDSPQKSASALPDDDVALLECERDLWGAGAMKEQVVFDRFGVSLPVYYQRLYRICHSQAALEYDSALVHHILDTADQVTTARRAKTLRREGL